MNLFLGLDLSLTGSGICIIDENYEIIFKTKLTTKQFGVERLFILEQQLQKVLNTYNENIKLCAIESPSFNSGKGEGSGGRLFDIGEWNGPVKLNLFKRGLDFVVASPLQLKKFIIGKAEKGSFTKDLIMLDIYRKYGVEIRENNIADAYVLSRIAHDFFMKPKGLSKAENEVLAKMSTKYDEECSSVLS